MSDYDQYLEAKRRYEELANNHPDLVRDLKALIDQYAEDRDEINSTVAGRSILSKDARLKAICGPLSARVFGVLLKEHLVTGEWVQDTEDVGNRKITVYRR